MAAGDIYQITGGLDGRKAVAFLGGATDDGVQIDTFAAGRVAANDTKGTFTAWINPADNTGTYAFIGCGDESAVQYFYAAVIAGEITIKSAMTGPNVAFDMVTVGADVKAHEWTHIAIVQDAVKPKIYINGVEFSLRKGTLTETDVTEPTYWFDTWALIDGGHIGCADSIAGGGALTLEFKGAIGAVKYWDTNLSDTQVNDDYVNANYTTNLIAHWDMNNGYVNVANAGTYDGTAVGDIILYNGYSEFDSRLRYNATPLVADDISFTASNGTGYAIVVKAA